jgi:hypothetical protein
MPHRAHFAESYQRDTRARTERQTVVLVGWARSSTDNGCTGRLLWYSLAPESSGLLFLVFGDPEPLLR